jgi:hypothetical protein
MLDLDEEGDTSWKTFRNEFCITYVCERETGTEIVAIKIAV